MLRFDDVIDTLSGANILANWIYDQDIGKWRSKKRINIKLRFR